VERIRQGEALPYSDRWAEQRRLAEQIDRQGKVVRGQRVALMDLREAPRVDPLALYQLHACPVAVTVTRHSQGGLRYTVGINPSVPEPPTDLSAILEALAAAEFLHGAPCLGAAPVPENENWGGRATVFGSPWNYPSRLSPDEVVRLCEQALG